MSTNFPGSLDDGTSLPNPAAGNTTNSPSLAGGQDNQNAAIIAVETKVGTGASTPTNNNFLVGTGTGTSAWTKAVPTGAVVGTSDSQTLTNKTLTSPTINTPTINNPTLKTDSVAGFTTSTNGTVYGMSVTGGVLASAAIANAVNTAALQSSAVTSAKIAAGAVLPNSLFAAASSNNNWSFDTFTPSWTGLTPGNGSNTGWYIKIGKLVLGHQLMVFGSTTAVTGSSWFTLPVPITTSHYTNNIIHYIGMVSLNAASLNASGFMIYNSAIGVDACQPVYQHDNGSAVTINGIGASAPGVWTTNNNISSSFWYETT